MDKDYSIWIVILAVVLVLVLILGGALWLDLKVCDASTAGIGFPHTWSVWSSCMIEPTPGQWIPLKNWRYFEQ
jgi:hypothetical protein